MFLQLLKLTTSAINTNDCVHLKHGKTPIHIKLLGNQYGNLNESEV